MLKNMLVLRDPLKLIGEDAMAGIENGGFAAILARAGVGKTALLVQLAIHAMIQGKNVLHISTENPVDKVTLWYHEVFQRLTQSYEISQADKLWDQLLHHRFIMTFESETFNLAKLQKRVSELTASDIFKPALIMIDGFSFKDETNSQLEDLKSFARENGLVFWFTVRTHRDEPVEQSGIPSSFVHFSAMFGLMLQLHPEQNRIYLKQLTGNGKSGPKNTAELYLDPATLLISDKPV